MLTSLPFALLVSTLSLTASARNLSSRSTRDLRSLPLHIIDPASQHAFVLPLPASAHAELSPSDDEPNFGAPCMYDSERPFLTCGDYLAPSTGTDHGLFCSPRGVCAGQGAVCGISEACGQGLECNLRVHKCAQKGSFQRSRGELRLESRRKASGGACPVESEVCPDGNSYSVSTSPFCM